MKYILLTDIPVLKKNWKVFLSYGFAIIAFTLLSMYESKSIVVDNINIKALGMMMSNNFLELLVYIITIVFYLYISFVLFMSNMRNGGQNLFSRISKKRYCLYKIVLICLFIFLCKLFWHICVSLLCKSSFDLNLLLIDFGFTIFLVLSVCIIFILSYYKKSISLVLLFLFILLLVFNSFLLSAFNYSVGNLLWINTVLLLIYIYISKFLFYVYERND